MSPLAIPARLAVCLMFVRGVDEGEADPVDDGVMMRSARLRRWHGASSVTRKTRA